MSTFDLDTIQTKINAFSRERDWDQFHSVKNLCMALSVETAELVEIFQWLSENDSNAIIKDEKSMENVKDEVADIFIYLLRISSRLKIDLSEAIYNKMQKNAIKYPVDKSFGNCKKYTELDEIK